MTGILPSLIVQATVKRRPRFVAPTERYRSSFPIISNTKSKGSLFSTCSASAGATLCAAKCRVFSLSQSNSIESSAMGIVAQRIYVSGICAPGGSAAWYGRSFLRSIGSGAGPNLKQSVAYSAGAAPCCKT